LQHDALKPRAYFYLAYSHLNLGDYEKAEEFFTEALRFTTDDPYIYVGLGVIAQSRQQYPQAKQLYRKALELDPDCQEAKENLRQIQDY
jgi:tetratricopeptide (TPR) repeat protein